MQLYDLYLLDNTDNRKSAISESTYPYEKFGIFKSIFRALRQLLSTVSAQLI